MKFMPSQPRVKIVMHFLSLCFTVLAWQVLNCIVSSVFRESCVDVMGFSV